MAPAKRNPEAGGLGARKADLLLATAKNSSENIQLHRLLQVRRLVERFGLSPTRAALVARLAFREGAQ